MNTIGIGEGIGAELERLWLGQRFLRGQRRRQAKDAQE
jgi:hypothetical protein